VRREKKDYSKSAPRCAKIVGLAASPPSLPYNFFRITLIRKAYHTDV